MNEQYLHFLWNAKRLPFHLLQTTDGNDVTILHPGFYNTASGPDFFNGRMVVENITHSGNIEMHVKSSDWYLHGHQHDKAYNNVILHVVYEHDRTVYVNGAPIPTIELKPFIDYTHFRNTGKWLTSPALLPCASQLNSCPEVVFWHQTERSALNRLERKGALLSNLKENKITDPREVLLHTIARSFGMKTNQLPFQEMARYLPLERMIRGKKKEIEAIVFGTGGFLDEPARDSFQQELQQEWQYHSAKLNLNRANRYSWHFKGCRPGGFPTLRLAQFSSFIENMDWSGAFWELPAAEIRSVMEQKLMAPLSDYWKVHYDFGKERSKPATAGMSMQTAHTIIINAIVPFLFWIAELVHNSIYREKAVELLEQLPSEKNSIIDNWTDLGFRPKSALESQGLIELKNELCTRKQCLSCKIGIELLKR